MPITLIFPAQSAPVSAPTSTPVFMIQVTDFKVAKENAVWGTYGKNGTDPLTFKKLVDLDTDHLEKILSGQHVHAQDGYAYLIRSILADRKTAK